MSITGADIWISRYNIENETNLIGANNVGKSTILKSVELLLGTTKQDVDDYR